MERHAYGPVQLGTRELKSHKPLMGEGGCQRLGGLNNEILIDLEARMAKISVPADSLPGESSLLGF